MGSRHQYVHALILRVDPLADRPQRMLGKAADQGHARAQYNLGVIYANEKGVAKDDSQALAWYRKAAEQGHASAQYHLGLMYANGEGVAQDDEQAVAWYRKAADQGNGDAREKLDLMDPKGVGPQ